jgi:hypothetical protein
MSKLLISGKICKGERKTEKLNLSALCLFFLFFIMGKAFLPKLAGVENNGKSLFRVLITMGFK